MLFMKVYDRAERRRLLDAVTTLTRQARRQSDCGPILPPTGARHRGVASGFGSGFGALAEGEAAAAAAIAGDDDDDPGPVTQWSLGDVLAWLQRAGFAAHAAAIVPELRDHAGSGPGAHLLAFDDTDLRDLFGMTDAAERRRFLAAAAALRPKRPT